MANRLVLFDPNHLPVFGYLLGNVFVVENLDKAVRLSKKYRQAYRLVTLQGDLISPGGSMTGGSIGQQSTNLISRNRQINELKNRIINLQEKAKKTEQLQQDQVEKQKAAAYELSKLTEYKIQLGLLAQSQETSKERADQLTKELNTINYEKTSLESELAELSNTNDLTTQREELEEAQKELQITEERITYLRAAITKVEAAQQNHMETIGLLNREAARLEARHEQIETESRRLHNEVWETYGLTYQHAMSLHNSEYSASFLKQEEKRLKVKLAELGTVNIGAIEAYVTLRERYDFLTEQKNDIRKAEEQLQEVIQQLTEQMEQQFAVQFALIGRHFNDVFKEMFGGGSAGLTMSDPDKVLESGIEISAQPPGKNLQNLSLLSGGERALTAIALLFGILRMKPSPFCVLDEIEAALDDTNVKRFSEFLKGYARETQFVIITHRKGTMENADTLYGVTMQEFGVSKMVSVDFSA